MNRTAPVVVDFVTTAFSAFVGDLPVPLDAETALKHRGTRTLRAAESLLNRPDVKITEASWGEGDPQDALAYLYVVADRVAKGWEARDIRRPGQTVPVLAEIDNALRAQTVKSRAGTDFKTIPASGPATMTR